MKPSDLKAMIEAATPGPLAVATVPINEGKGLCHKIGPLPASSSYYRDENYACIYGDGLRIGIDDNLPAAKQLRATAGLFALLHNQAPAILAMWEAAANVAEYPNVGDLHEALRTALAGMESSPPPTTS